MNNKETVKAAFSAPKSRHTPGKNISCKKISAALFCLTAALLLSSCSLALDEAPSRPGQDRLAGIFVTSEYIRQGTPEIKITGTGVTDYSSENDIVGYYTCDDFFTDLYFFSTDEEEGAEGSIYISPDVGFVYYFNPVYQQADGQIYLLPGTGLSTTSFTDGQKQSHDTSQSITRNRAGKEETKSYRFKVSIVAADPPAETELFFMSEDHQLLQSLTEAQLDALGERESPGLELPADVSYLILRQKTKNGAESTHRLFDRGEETLTYMMPAENHMLREIQLPLFWQDAGQ